MSYEASADAADYDYMPADGIELAPSDQGIVFCVDEARF